MMKKTLFLALFIGLAPVTLLAESPQLVNKPSIYVVKKGDCLWTISKRVWGDPTKWPLLYATNQDNIRNPNLIYAGQKFTVPTTITADELKKATQLAYSKTAPIGVRSTGPEGTRLVVHKTHKTSPAAEKAVALAAVKEALATVEKTSPPATTQESQPSAAAPASTSSSGRIVSLLLALVALVAGVYFWMKGRPSPSELQAPRPISTFPSTGEPGQRPSTPFSTSQAYPAPSQPVTPTQPAASPSVDKPAAYSGTMTSVSTPTSSAPAMSQPAESATQLPLTPPTQAPAETQAPPPSPAPPAAEENKPSDTPPPSSSSGHAA
jgi:hypothetical protein